MKGPGKCPRLPPVQLPCPSLVSTTCHFFHRNIWSHFVQFEEDILSICLTVLDKSLNFRRDPATDVARRGDPKYVGRVLSAMVSNRTTMITCYHISKPPVGLVHMLFPCHLAEASENAVGGC